MGFRLSNPREKASVTPSNGKMVEPSRKAVSGFHHGVHHFGALGLVLTTERVATPGCTKAVFWGFP